MELISYFDKRILEDIFNMQGGYVLNFNNNSFHDFFRSTVGISIYDDKYATRGESKANRLRTFWELESEDLVFSVIENLIKVIEIEKISVDPSKLERVKKMVQNFKINTDRGVTVPTGELDHIWEPGKIRLFISHRDKHKKDVAGLAKRLGVMGIAGFVAHDAIHPTTKWKDEIHRGLLTMDAFVAYITRDFYESVWTNQELGFAFCRGVPIFLYSVDGTDPEGFYFDIQAIKNGESKLFSLLKETFKSHQSLKDSLLMHFYNSRNGTFDGAKIALLRIIGLELSNSEIEKIVKTIYGSADYLNQLKVLLTNEKIKEELRMEFRLSEERYYELLKNRVLSQHSENRFRLEFDEEKQMSKIIDGGISLR